MARGLKRKKPTDVRAELRKVDGKVATAKKKRRKKAASDEKRAAQAQRAGPKPVAGDACPWWDPGLDALYSKLPREAPDATPENAHLRGGSTSWFAVKRIPLVAAESGGGWRARMGFEPNDVWSQEADAHRKAATSRKGKALAAQPIKQHRCKAIRIRFDCRDDEKAMRKWMGAHRLTYNAAVKLVRTDKRWVDAEGQYLNEQLVYASKNGTTSKTNAKSTEDEIALAAEHSANMELKRKSLGVAVGALVGQHPWLLQVPSRIRKNAVRDVVKAEKSNEGMRDADPRHHSWTLKLKKRGNPSAWTIGVSTECISKVVVQQRPLDTRRPRRDGGDHPETNARDWTRVTICPKYKFPSFWLNEAVPNGRIDKDCKITVDARGRFYMVVPYEIEAAPATRVPLDQRRVGAIDPGDRVQATVYSPSDGEVVQYAVGKEGGGKDAIFRVCKKIDETIAEANKPENRDTPSKRRASKAKLARLRARVRNLVTEARNKITLDMTRRWDTLILPPFETGGMVKRRQRSGLPRKLHSKVARSLMSWRHYDFAVHVKNKFLRAGGEVVSPDERYTTMCCGVCGVLNDKHSDEQWTCKNPGCKAFHLRDPAASRCIFLKCLKSTEACGQLQPTNHQAHDAISLQSDGSMGCEDVRS